jgi:hypothetical protein
MGASKRVTIPSGPVLKKGLAGEGKTLQGILKSWVEPRKTINRV